MSICASTCSTDSTATDSTRNSVSSCSSTSCESNTDQLAEFRREMKNLDKELTKEYRLARERVPDIVAIESDPLKHLRAENGDARKAATRVALYWKKRRHYFREDRWLLPMTQTGAGALSPEDIQVLRSGYIVLATLHADLQVALWDPTKLEGRDPGESRERCIFYLCTNEINERSARVGLEFIYLLTPYGFGSERHTELIDVVYTAMPVKVRHMTVLQSMEAGRQELLDFLSFRLEKTFIIFTPTKVSVVRVDSRQTVVDALQRRGIHSRYLPKQLGGDYDYSQLSEWVQNRLVVENAMGSALPLRNAIPFHFRRQSTLSVKRVHRRVTRVKCMAGSAQSHTTLLSSIVLNDFQRSQNDSQSQRKRQGGKKDAESYVGGYLLNKHKSPKTPGDKRCLEEILVEVLSD